MLKPHVEDEYNANEPSIIINLPDQTCEFIDRHDPKYNGTLTYEEVSETRENMEAK
jgi:hypothetical protein